MTMTQPPLAAGTAQNGVSQATYADDQRTDLALRGTLHGLFEEQARRRPEAVAVICGSEQLTYGQLNGRANAVARVLQELGVGPEVLVGLSAERSLEMIVGLLGILKAGGAYLPLDPTLPAERLAFMVADCQVGIVLTQQRLVKNAPAWSVRQLLLDSPDFVPQDDEPNPVSAVQGSNLAYVIFTSGSTGQPKGAGVEHAAAISTLRNLNERFEVGPADRMLAMASFAFDPSVYDIFGLLAVGGGVVLLEERLLRQPEGWVDLVQRHQVTLWNSVPTSLESLVASAAGRTERPLDSLRLIWSGGDAMPLELPGKIRALNSHAQIVNVGGNTEASIISFIYPVGAIDPAWKCIPYGSPLPDHSFRILDEQFQPCDVGVPGQLFLGGKGLARGYIGRPELTKAKFISDPHSDDPQARLFATGDLAVLRSDGLVDFLGRIDNQVKIRGYRIELGEIETALAKHPLVREAVVTTFEESPGRKQIIAFIVPARHPAPSYQELRGFMGQSLPDYMLPAKIVLLERLPLAANNKVDRRALANCDLSQYRSATGSVPPADEVERRLVNIWESAFSLDAIGVEDDFFELAGDSLVAAGILIRVEQDFGVEFSSDVLIEAPTIRALARLLRGAPEKRAFAPVAIRATGSRPPLFCLPGIGGSLLEFNELAKHLDSEQPVYGLRPLGIDGREAPHNSIAEMAAHHIDEMRSVQPEGPYYLAGYSLGGVVAFEMALQLEAQHQQVALLVLFDTMLWAPYQPLPLLQRMRLHWWHMRHSNNYGRWRYVISKLRLLGARLRRGNMCHEDADLVVGLDITPALRRVAQVHWEAAKVYQPKVYHGLVTLFAAAVQFNPPKDQKPDPTMGWSAWSDEPVEVHVTPGTHAEMLNSRHVKTLAPRLTACIERTWTRFSRK